MKVERESEVIQSCPTLRYPMDCSPPGSSVHGIFQARVLERGAIAFSSDLKYMCVKMKSHLQKLWMKVKSTLKLSVHDQGQNGKLFS